MMWMNVLLVTLLKSTASKCPDKEELILASFGEETCDGRKPNPCKPVTECRCIPGYVRHNGKCIRKCDCRKFLEYCWF